MSLIGSSHITSKNNSGVIQTEDLLRNHFYTEIPHKGKSYFLTDSEWFEIKASFTNKLNEQCQDFINDNTSTISLSSWNPNKESENDFNAKHIGKNNFLVFDKFTPENIEACDILHWNQNNVYFIHVKSGFGNSMRDLTHQIFIAARRIKEDIKSGYNYLGNLYDLVKNNQGISSYSKNAKNQLTNIKKSDFVDLFKTRKPVFVLAVVDTSKKNRSLKKVDDFSSNIAKFSLHELVKNMRNLAVDFEIYEI